MTAGLSFVKNLEENNSFCLLSQLFKEIFKRKIQKQVSKNWEFLVCFTFFWILSYDSIFKKATRVGFWATINTQPLHLSLNSELLPPVLNPKQHSNTSLCRFVIFTQNQIVGINILENCQFLRYFENNESFSNIITKTLETCEDDRLYIPSNFLLISSKKTLPEPPNW